MGFGVLKPKLAWLAVAIHRARLRLVLPSPTNLVLPRFVKYHQLKEGDLK